ncbi:MAG: bifunctional diaminohydroxyphosphoribosylaminopyrimidine deaminase/5-amino-6-(5-phosphoribosylamino)uracil reductase RibD [Azospirillum brasilense]|nr:MAG: bifunctional diaminohydroxyphosphoribosylaminopyrimidine deaminase/5-amino-6-(5-phosphoribosylamino)uracil reductase RibD [Azospirillum brasilense]
MSAADQQFLQHAVRLGLRHQGRTAENPSVGCVLVKNGHVLATAVTALGGRPHAETQALAQAGDAARGATAYVTLEPCAHHGKTPPCAQALIDAGVARVVYAVADADARVDGKGAAMLRHAGIDVLHLPIPHAAALHRGFLRRTQHGLPEVLLKLATSMDGHMRDMHGMSQWITGPRARQHGHLLRSSVNAMLTGIGTVLADDPQLTARLPGDAHPSLLRAVADRQLRLPLTAQLVRTAEMQPTWVFTTPEAVEMNASHATELRERGVVLQVLEAEAFTPLSMLRALAAHGAARVLVEAGPVLSTRFLADQAVDTLYWYRAPVLLGSGGSPAIGPLAVDLATAERARCVAQFSLGDDQCSVYEMPSCLPA